MFKSTLAAMGCCFRSFLLFLPQQWRKGTTHVLLTTSAGNIELELDKQKAPVSVQNFVDYEAAVFITTLPFTASFGFMIQRRRFHRADAAEKPNPPIKMKPITACATR